MVVWYIHQSVTRLIAGYPLSHAWRWLAIYLQFERSTKQAHIITMHSHKDWYLRTSQRGPVNTELHVHVKEPLWSTQVAPLRHGPLAQALKTATYGTRRTLRANIVNRPVYMKNVTTRSRVWVLTSSTPSKLHTSPTATPLAPSFWTDKYKTAWLQRNHRFRSLLSFWAATPLQSFLLSPLFVRHTHAQNPTPQPQNPWLSHFLTLCPHILNNLPQDIRHSATLSSLKSQLKTFLFSEYFS